jgi:hypothetical protein
MTLQQYESRKKLLRKFQEILHGLGTVHCIGQQQPIKITYVFLPLPTVINDEAIP